MDWKVGMDLGGVGREDEYDQHIMYEILKELVKLRRKGTPLIKVKSNTNCRYKQLFGREFDKSLLSVYIP